MAQKYEIKTKRNDISKEELLDFLKREFPNKKVKNHWIQGIIIPAIAYIMVKIKASDDTITLSTLNTLYVFIPIIIFIWPFALVVMGWSFYEKKKADKLFDEIKAKLELNFSKDTIKLPDIVYTSTNINMSDGKDAEGEKFNKATIQEKIEKHNFVVTNNGHNKNSIILTSRVVKKHSK